MITCLIHNTFCNLFIISSIFLTFKPVLFSIHTHHYEQCQSTYVLYEVINVIILLIYVVYKYYKYNQVRQYGLRPDNIITIRNNLTPVIQYIAP